jgi:hypothetical protein
LQWRLQPIRRPRPGASPANWRHRMPAGGA